MINRYYIRIIQLFIAILVSICAFGQQSRVTVHATHPVMVKDVMSQSLLIKSEVSDVYHIKVTKKFYGGNNDSSVIYNYSMQDVHLGKGYQRIQVKSNSNLVYQYVIKDEFKQIFRHSTLLPVGTYTTEFKFFNAVDTIVILQIQEKDSLIVLTELLGNLSKKIKINNQEQLTKHIIKKVIKSKNIKSVESEDKIEFWSYGYFLGYVANYSIPKKIKQELANTLSTKDYFQELKFGNPVSVSDIMVKMKKNDQKSLDGFIESNNHFANESDPYSDQSRNYAELMGNVTVPILGIPIEVTGLYTTQDRGKKIKSSFINVRYDSEKAKEKLSILLDQYKKVNGSLQDANYQYQGLYGGYKDQLEQLRMTELRSFNEITKLKVSDLGQVSDYTDQVLAVIKKKVLDSLQNMEQQLPADEVQSLIEKKVDSVKAVVAATEQKIKALDEKIEKVKRILDQYNNVAMLDSALIMQQIESIGDTRDLNYKQLLNKSQGVLDQSKSKNLLNGVESVDVGILTKFISNYTLNGQYLKGVDAMYSLGGVSFGGTFGQSQSISSYGEIADYKIYGFRGQVKQMRHHEIMLSYLNTRPGNDFFEHWDSTEAPVSSNEFKSELVALSASGEVKKLLNYHVEFASNLPVADNKDFLAGTALMMNVQTAFPLIRSLFQLEYERVGQRFNNPTLPFILHGVERINANSTTTLLRNKLIFKLAYHQMLQTATAYDGKNRKLGFEIGTNFKGYPNLVLSYKPFEAFKSINDTLLVQQKPLFGQIYTGRVNYVYKKLNQSIRFNAQLNYNNNILGDIKYTSTVIQGTVLYQYDKNSYGFVLGYNDVNTNSFEVVTELNKNYLINIFLSRPLTKQLFTTSGLESSFDPKSINKIGAFTHLNYDFSKMPLSLSLNLRYNKYNIKETQFNQHIYNVMLGLRYNFNFELY